jgi:hypothetical protein
MSVDEVARYRPFDTPPGFAPQAIVRRDVEATQLRGLVTAHGEGRDQA